jgi:O-antigen ligase
MPIALENNKSFSINSIWIYCVSSVLICSISTIIFGLKFELFFLAILVIALVLLDGKYFLYLYISSFPVVLFFYEKYINMFGFGLLVAMVFIWVSRKLLIREKPIFSKTLIVFLVPLASLILVSALNNGITIGENGAIRRNILFFIFIFMIYDIYNPIDTIKYFIAMTIPVVLSSILVLFDFSQTRGLVEFYLLYRHRPSGLFYNGNVFAGAIIIVLPLWIALSVWYKNKGIRLFAIIVSIILSMGLLLTNSRAAFLGMALVTILFLYWARKLKYLVITAAIVFAILAALPQARFITYVALRVDQGVSFRDKIWATSMNMIAKNPWLGIGLGNFTTEYNKYFTSISERRFFVTGVPHAHNQIIGKTAELGILGLFATLVLYYLPIRSGVKAFRKMKNSNDKIVILGIIGGIIAIYGRSIFESSGIFTEGRLYPDMLFWILFIMLLKIHEMLNCESGYFFKSAKKLIE